MAKLSISMATGAAVSVSASASDPSWTSASAANPFLSADGLVDVAAIEKLNKRITAANGKLSSSDPESTKRVVLKFASLNFYTSKELPKFSAALDKKNDHKYKTLRGQQIKSFVRIPATGFKSKRVTLLVAAREGIDKAVLAEVKKAVSAINSHNKKAEKVVGKVKVEKTKIRDAANAEFDGNVESLKSILLAGGIKETSIVVGQSMFGKVVHVKLPNGGVVSVGKSDTTKFNAAKKTAGASAAPADAPPALLPKRSARIAVQRGTRNAKKAAAVKSPVKARRPS